MIIGFVGMLALITGLIHLYLWKRLVRDTTRPGRLRRVGGLLAVLLAVLIPATLVGTRAGADWLGWPGYLWLALMFYLLVLLALLELPMLAARLWLRHRERDAHRGRTARSAAPVPTGRPAPPAEGPHRAGRTSTTDQPTDDAAAGAGTAGPTQERPTGYDPDRRLLLARGAAIFAGLTAAGITGYGVRTALGPPQLDRVQIPLDRLPRSLDGVRIALVSDIHLGPLVDRSHTERIVATANRADADLVAIVGDLVDGTVEELGPAAEPLRDLRSRHGTFFVTGNHEYYAGHEDWLDELARLEVRTLRNERLPINTRIGEFDLAGVNDVGGEAVGDPPNYAAALAGRDPTKPVVLLAHQPVQAHDAARYGVDLQLSGHTHGGQMMPFNLLVRLEQPVVAGLGEVDGTKVYVTNGAGFWGPPVRVGAPPQVTLVELRSTA